MDRNVPEVGVKPVSINMRADLKRRNLIDAAAEILCVDRTSFILDAACRRAEEVIVDRKLFLLSDEAFERFERALEANPLSANERVKALLAAPKPWS
ncbi:type II toxin-antitoxin system TacA family antitoxin [Pseudomonas sp. MLB6B]